ncbi:hypothetical protein CXG81DRAFT_27070 [Caulochytrium protostelioides]|uniref:Uncharacterized protein n=1 Tax=Caulochytrium protostelioides TaxID=1555241 RepID=A0A4P9X536_9FUNG|nr:hypothetical protein CXG81DRAFT_27070 [Caulochytrium protostelioides]|eukprot:RKP00214.1 hypothetical protein CXG81DRAFT_27070 [Caulochytrium protostelioides]
MTVAATVPRSNTTDPWLTPLHAPILPPPSPIMLTLSPAPSPALQAVFAADTLAPLARWIHVAVTPFAPPSRIDRAAFETSREAPPWPSSWIVLDDVLNEAVVAAARGCGSSASPAPPSIAPPASPSDGTWRQLEEALDSGSTDSDRPVWTPTTRHALQQLVALRAVLLQDPSDLPPQGIPVVVTAHAPTSGCHVLLTQIERRRAAAWQTAGLLPPAAHADPPRRLAALSDAHRLLDAAAARGASDLVLACRGSHVALLDAYAFGLPDAFLATAWGAALVLVERLPLDAAAAAAPAGQAAPRPEALERAVAAYVPRHLLVAAIGTVSSPATSARRRDLTLESLVRAMALLTLLSPSPDSDANSDAGSDAVTEPSPVPAVIAAAVARVLHVWTTVLATPPPSGPRERHDEAAWRRAMDADAARGMQSLRSAVGETPLPLSWAAQHAMADVIAATQHVMRSASIPLVAWWLPSLLLQTLPPDPTALTIDAVSTWAQGLHGALYQTDSWVRHRPAWIALQATLAHEADAATQVLVITMLLEAMAAPRLPSPLSSGLARRFVRAGRDAWRAVLENFSDAELCPALAYAATRPVWPAPTALPERLHHDTLVEQDALVRGSFVAVLPATSRTALGHILVATVRSALRPAHAPLPLSYVRPLTSLAGLNLILADPSDWVALMLATWPPLGFLASQIEADGRDALQRTHDSDGSCPSSPSAASPAAVANPKLLKDALWTRVPDDGLKQRGQHLLFAITWLAHLGVRPLDAFGARARAQLLPALESALEALRALHAVNLTFGLMGFGLWLPVASQLLATTLACLPRAPAAPADPAGATVPRLMTAGFAEPRHGPHDPWQTRRAIFDWTIAWQQASQLPLADVVDTLLPVLGAYLDSAALAESDDGRSPARVHDDPVYVRRARFELAVITLLDVAARADCAPTTGPLLLTQALQGFPAHPAWDAPLFGAAVGAVVRGFSAAATAAVAEAMDPGTSSSTPSTTTTTVATASEAATTAAASTPNEADDTTSTENSTDVPLCWALEMLAEACRDPHQLLARVDAPPLATWSPDARRRLAHHDPVGSATINDRDGDGDGDKHDGGDDDAPEKVRTRPPSAEAAAAAAAAARAGPTQHAPPGSPKSAEAVSPAAARAPLADEAAASAYREHVFLALAAQARHMTLKELPYLMDILSELLRSPRTHLAACRPMWKRLFAVIADEQGLDFMKRHALVQWYHAERHVALAASVQAVASSLRPRL